MSVPNIKKLEGWLREIAECGVNGEEEGLGYGGGYNDGRVELAQDILEEYFDER